MEIYNAKIERKDGSAILKLTLGSTVLDIVLTEDKPIEVKNVFNRLIRELKRKNFKFEFQDELQDLYFHICKEYITQLNSEMASIRKELEDFRLVEVEEIN